MKKITFLLFTLLVAGKFLSAQTLDEGRKSLYYQRTTTARQTLEKVVAANPKNGEAIYWLGQTYLNNNSNTPDIAGAQKIYQDALNSGVNDPWVWVGMGHVESLQGKKDLARQHFEAAITNSMNKKKENPDILNAIGRANADGPSTVGDPAYAIEKLKRAAELKPTDPDIQVNMGINYLKLGPEHGGEAFTAFTAANRIDPKYALGSYRLGKIFESQGNLEKFTEYYNAAISADPTYAPAYLALYNYYSDRDVNKAREYLDKYIANTEKDCNTEYFYADYLLRSGKYQESLDKAKAMEAGACRTYPRLKVLYAYDYDRLGDSVQARNNITSFLSTAKPGDAVSRDYELAGRILFKFPGSEAQAAGYFDQAMAADTVTANRINTINSIITTLGTRGQYAEQLKWYKRLARIKTDLSARDLFYMGNAAIQAADFASADTVYNLYIQKYPDQPQGYSGRAKAAIAADKDTTTGSAVPAVMQYIQFMEKTDKEKFKNTILTNYGYLVYVHANVQKDYPAALKDLEGILAVDPANTYAQTTSEQIKKVMAGPKQPAKPAAPSPQKTTTQKPPSTKKTK